MNAQKSTIEVAIELMEKKKLPQNIMKLMNEVSEIMGVDGEDPEFLAQLYIDITTSARFIFCGDDMWDLKERQVDLWDKDGSFFNDKDLVEEEDDDDLTLDDYNLDDEEDEDNYEYDDDEYETDTDDDEEDDELSDFHTVDEEDEESTFDEDKYDAVMDDYEDLYDDK